jgi:hypothetical protein
MVLETAQLLATANGGKAWRNHPCAVWTRESTENYAWLYRLGVALCTQYSARYGREHAYTARYRRELRVLPTSVPRVPATAPPQCMPDAYKGPDAVQAYRRYYVAEKLRFARWAHNEEPAWLDDFVKE